MGKIIVNNTVHGSIRLLIHRDQLPEEPVRTCLLTALDALSAWGGRDILDDDKFGWEFTQGFITKAQLVMFLSRYKMEEK